MISLLILKKTETILSVNLITSLSPTPPTFHSSPLHTETFSISCSCLTNFLSSVSEFVLYPLILGQPPCLCFGSHPLASPGLCFVRVSLFFSCSISLQFIDMINSSLILIPHAPPSFSPFFLIFELLRRAYSVISISVFLLISWPSENWLLFPTILLKLLWSPSFYWHCIIAKSDGFKNRVQSFVMFGEIWALIT